MNKYELATNLIWATTPLAVMLVAFGTFQLIANDNPCGFVLTLTATIAYVLVLWLYYELTNPE